MPCNTTLNDDLKFQYPQSRYRRQSLIAILHHAALCRFIIEAGSQVVLCHGMSSRPLSSCFNRRLFILLPFLRHFGSQRVIGIWCAEESLDGEEDGADLEGRGPVALQDVQAYTTELIDIGMVDLGEESYLWRGHRVIIWQE